MLVGLGVAQRQVGIPAYRETLLQAAWAADRAGDVELLARAALANNRGWQSRTDGTADEERLAVLNRALVGIGEHAPATRARLLALLGAEQIYTKALNERIALAEEAVALARSCGDATTTVHVLIHAHRAIIGPSTLARRRAWVTEGLGLANELGDPFLQVQSLDTLMLGALERADRGGFEELLNIKAGILETLPDANLQWSHAFHLALQAVLVGDLEIAEDLATAALNFGLETGQEDALIIFGAQLLNIRIRQGRLAELIPLVEDAVASRPRLGVYRAVLAVARAEAGDLERSRQLLEAEYAAGFAVPEDTNWTTTNSYWAESAVRVGNVDAADMLLGRITPFADQLATTQVSMSPVLAHSIARLQHFLGRLDDADTSYRQALHLHEGLRCPIFVCTTQAAWAALLADRDGDDDRMRAGPWLNRRGRSLPTAGTERRAQRRRPARTSGLTLCSTAHFGKYPSFASASPELRTSRPRLRLFVPTIGSRARPTASRGISGRAFDHPSTRTYRDWGGIRWDPARTS